MRGSQNPGWRRGCVYAPPSRKFFEAPNNIYSHTKFQLSNLLPEIWSPLFPIGLPLRGPKKMGFGGF